MNYNIGDTIKIKDNIEIGMGISGVATVVKEMLIYKGKIAKIKHINKDGLYHIQIDNCRQVWTWTEEMFEIYEESFSPKNKLHSSLIGKKFKHYKGSMYEIINLSVRESTLETDIIYKSLETGIIWNRSIQDFYKFMPSEDCFRFTEV